mgnify:CR=1 FL=1
MNKQITVMLFLFIVSITLFSSCINDTPGNIPEDPGAKRPHSETVTITGYGFTRGESKMGAKLRGEDGVHPVRGFQK